MGNLTADMTRLRGEIDALRTDRGALMQGLLRGVKDRVRSVADRSRLLADDLDGARRAWRGHGAEVRMKPVAPKAAIPSIRHADPPAPPATHAAVTSRRSSSTRAADRKGTARRAG